MHLSYTLCLQSSLLQLSDTKPHCRATSILVHNVSAKRPWFSCMTAQPVRLEGTSRCLRKWQQNRLLCLCSVARTLLLSFQKCYLKRDSDTPRTKLPKRDEGRTKYSLLQHTGNASRLVFQSAQSQSIQGPTCCSSVLTIGGNCSSTFTIGGSSCGASTLLGVCLHRSPLPARRRTLSGATSLLQPLQCDKRMHEHQDVLSNPPLASCEQHAGGQFEQAYEGIWRLTSAMARKSSRVRRPCTSMDSSTLATTLPLSSWSACNIKCTLGVFTSACKMCCLCMLCR